MTMTVVGTGAMSHSNNSVSPAYPAGYTAVAGDLCVIVVASGHSTIATQPTASDYTLRITGNNVGSNVTYGVNTGGRRLTYFYTTLVAGQAAPTVLLATGTNVTLSAYVLIIRSTVTGVVWDINGGTGADNTAATSISAAITNPGLTLDDLIIQNFAAVPSTATVSAVTLTATGATIGAASTIVQGANSSAAQLRFAGVTRVVTAGTASANPTSGCTLSASGSGVTGILRIRERAALDLTNTFEGGTHGTAITTGNSGGASGVAYDFVSTVTGATITYSNLNAYRGLYFARFTTTSTGGNLYLERQASLTGLASTGAIYGRYRVRVPTLPASSVRTTIIADSTGGFQIDPRINNLGKVELRTGTGTLIGTSTRTYAAGDWIDMGVAILNFGTTNGQLEMKLYHPDTGAVEQTITSAANIDTLRAGGLNRIQVGMMQSLTNFTIDFDDMAWSTTGYPTTTHVSQAITLTSSFTDNFDDGVIDTRWTNNYGTVSEMGGRGRVASNPDPTFDGFASDEIYTLDSLSVRLYPAPLADGTGDVFTAFWFQNGNIDGTDVGIYVETSTGNIWFASRTGYFDAGATIIVFDPVAHAFGRLLISGGNLLFQTSPDNDTWTTRRTLAIPAWITGHKLGRINLETHRGGGTAQFAEFDYMNHVGLVPNTSPVNNTVDLRWRSAVTVSQTTDLRWRVAARVSQDADLRWRVRTSVSATTDLRWRSRAQVTASTDLRWRSIARVIQTVDLRWKSIARVTQTTDLRWRVRTVVAQTVDVRWRSRVAISQTSELRWRSYAGIAQTVDLRWKTLNLTEYITWPIEPTLTDGVDPGENYNLGTRFHLITPKQIFGARWRVPDSVSAPPGGNHVLSLFDFETETVVAQKIFTPTPGVYQDIFFDTPFMPDGVSEYVIAIYTVHYTFATPPTGSSWEEDSPSGNIVANQSRLISSGSPNLFPGNTFTAWYYISPIVATDVAATPVSNTVDLRWRSAAQVQQTSDLRWRVAARISQTVDLRWRDYVRIFATTDIRWRDYQQLPFGSVIDLRWKSGGQVQQTVSLLWRDYVQISQLTDIRWKSRSAVSATLDLRWRSRSQVTQSVDLRWKTIGLLSQTVDLRWKSYGSVTATTDLRWRTYAAVAPATVDLRWRTYIDVLSDVSLQYRVRTRLQTDLDLRWRNRVAVTPATLDLRWRSRAQASNTVDLQWKVLSQLFPVENDVELRWRSAARVSATTDLRWRAYNKTTGSIDLRWRSLLAVFPQPEVIVVWRSRTLVQQSVDLRWRNRTALAQTVDLRWRSRGQVTSSLDLRWLARARVAADLSALWRSRAIVTSSVDLRWRDYVIVGQTSDLRWRVIGRVTREFVLLWDSKALGAAPPEEGFVVNVAPRVVSVDLGTTTALTDVLPPVVIDRVESPIWIVDRS